MWRIWWIHWEQDGNSNYKNIDDDDGDHDDDDDGDYDDGKSLDGSQNSDKQQNSDNHYYILL